MARKKGYPEHANHERWLVSYADFITLMFAFFVVMFASSQTDKGKAHQVSESVKKALEQNQFASAIAGILGGTADDKGKGNAMMRGPGGARTGSEEPKTPAKVAELLPSQKFLNESLKKEIETGKVQVHMSSRGLVVSLREAAFFSPGDDTISAPAYPTIGKIAETIRQLPNPVRLEGHTDSVPIHNSRFRSNWELSAARSIAMLELLNGRFEIPRQKLAVVGYAETAPVDTNETAEGRARNRRVDIVILNQSGLTAESPQAASKPSPFAEGKR
ncbi:MAG: OmpA family protein [Acidobacteria bacterium]|nr:OmpA family protein [Acidobacteriota bacterium]